MLDHAHHEIGPDRFLLTGEVARLLGISAVTVRLWERTGRLPALRASSNVRLFKAKDVERLKIEREARCQG
jgi:excisionase family DNA binding protein